MLPKTAHIFKETSCNDEQVKIKTKGGCPKPIPGAAAGGCAFDGATIVLSPITDSVHLVHGPIGCLGNSWENRGSLSSGSLLFKKGFTTDMSNHEIIYGGGDKLENAILYIAKKYSPASIFVYSTCVSAMIGDDIEAVCKKVGKRVTMPVIPVNVPGFVGSKNLGNKLAGDALMKYVIGTEEPEGKTAYDFNLIGEYNIAGELWSIIPLFEELGLRLYSTISGDSRYKQMASCHKVKANVVVCGRALVSIAEKMKKKFSIPYFEGSFYGIENTGNTLCRLAHLMGDLSLLKKTKMLVNKKEKETREKLKPYIEKIKGKKALLYTGGVKSWSVVSALKECGLTVVATGTRKSTEDDKRRIKEIMGENARMIEKGDPHGLLSIMKDEKAHILVAGGRNQYTAYKGGYPFLDINQERQIPYTGYSGIINLAKQLDNSINSPVWKRVKQK